MKQGTVGARGACRARGACSRRRILARGLALGGGAALAACGTSVGTSGGGDQKAAQGLTPATIAASNLVDHAAAMQAYMQEFPQIKVDYTPTGGTGPHYEKVQASSVAGTPSTPSGCTTRW